MIRSVVGVRPRHPAGVAASAWYSSGAPADANAEVIDASLTYERTLLLGISACKPNNNRAEVQQEPDAVIISVSTD